MIYLMFLTVALFIWSEAKYYASPKTSKYNEEFGVTVRVATALLVCGLFSVFISNAIYYNVTKEQVVTVESEVYTDLRSKAFELNLEGASVFEFVLDSEDGIYETLRVARDDLTIIFTDEPVAKIQGVEHVPASKGFWFHLFGAPWATDDMASGKKSYTLFVPIER